MTTSVDPNTRSANSAAPAGTAPATPIPSDKTGSANIKRPTRWSQPVQTGSGTAPAGFARKTREAIGKALKELSDAMTLLGVASDRAAAETRVRVAGANLGQVIADQTRNLQRSSLVAQEERDSTKVQPASCLQVRKLEAIIISDPRWSSDEKSLLEHAMLENKKLRLPGELEMLSSAMTKGSLKGIQIKEREAIVADWKAVVTGVRPEDKGKSPDDLKTSRLGRLRDELDRVIKKEGNEKKFNPYAYDWLIISVQNYLDLNDNDRLHLKAEYEKGLGPR